jgi:hypothetical protein
MAAKWNFVVLVSLEFWLADNGDIAADHTTLTLDCAAAAKHIGRYHHSRRVQCGCLCRRGKRSRHLGGMSGSRPRIAVRNSSRIIGSSEAESTPFTPK